MYFSICNNFERTLYVVVWVNSDELYRNIDKRKVSRHNFSLEVMKRVFLLFCFINPLQGRSSKKGLCIPPGENFHCGDLAAFKNVRCVFIVISS